MTVQGPVDVAVSDGTIAASPEAGVWAIETPVLALRWKRDRGGDTRLVSLRTGGREWVSSPVPVFAIAGSSTPVAFEDVEATVVDGRSLRLCGRVPPSGLTVVMSVTVYEPDSVVVADIEVENRTGGDVELGSLSSLHLTVPRDGDASLAVLAGGRWDESLPPRGYRLQTTDLDEIGRRVAVGAAADGRSSGEHVPWFALLDDAGGLLAAMAWSGRWQLGIARSGEDNGLTFGISDFSHRLAPGEKLALPSVVLAGFAGDLDDGANAWRRWVSRYWMPSTPPDWPWIHYNHWYAYFGDIDAERLLEEARLAATAGCEVFVIDDGWFRGRRPDSYVAGWGDWVEDLTRFPDGLRAFGEQVRSLGMRFGLWVEPERADEDGDLVRQHPDWVATRRGGPIRKPGSDGPEGVHLCLGNPEVQRWMTDEIIRVVRDYGVDWLKWDYNMGYGLGCDAEDHGHQSTDGHFAHTHGLYAVLARLRAACPDLVIENCASGGHRIDLGTLRHTHTNWVSDYTHRAASCRQHVQGAGLVLPLVHLNTWALEDRDLSDFRSRMGGAFGVSSFMGRWTAEERATFEQAVAEYRRIRPCLTGDRYLLTGPWHGDWDAWQIVHPSDGSFAILAFRDHGHVSEIRVHPRVPDMDRTWRIERASGGTAETVSGRDLAANGIVISIEEVPGSEILWCSPTSPEADRTG